MLLPSFFDPRRFAVLTALAALPVILLDVSCGTACLAVCVPQLDITIDGVVEASPSKASAFVLTFSNDGTPNGGFTCTSTETGVFSCGGASAMLTDDKIIMELVGYAPEAFDLLLTRDGTTLLSTRVTPSYGTHSLCGEECAYGMVTLHAQK